MAQPTKISFEEMEQLQDRWRNDYVLCARELLNIDPWWGQQEFLYGVQKKKFTMFQASRGSGKSYVCAAAALIYAALNNRCKVLIIGPSYRQAKIIFSEIENIYTQSPLLQSFCAKRPTISSDSCYLLFVNGSRITGLPLGVGSDGAKILGHRAHMMVIDEWPQVPKSIVDQVLLPMMNVKLAPMEEYRLWEEEMYKRKYVPGHIPQDVNALLRTDNRLVFASSAFWGFHPSYLFYSEWKRLTLEVKDPDYGFFEYNFLDVPTVTECLDCTNIENKFRLKCPRCESTNIKYHGFLDIKTILMQKETQPKDVFCMMNLSMWPKDAGGLYRMANILECVPQNEEDYYTIETGCDGVSQYVLGIDPARDNSNFGFTVIKLDGEKMKVVWMKTIRPDEYKTSNPTLEAVNVIRNLHHRFQFKIIAMDKGGGGSQIRDELSKEYEIFDERMMIQLKKPPILQLEGQEERQKGLRGVRILDLVYFAPAWIEEVAFALKARLENLTILFPCVPRDSDPEKLEIYPEIEELFNEMVCICHKPEAVGGLARIDKTPKTAMIDRVASLWLAVYAASSLIQGMLSGSLPYGFAHQGSVFRQQMTQKQTQGFGGSTLIVNPKAAAIRK